MRYFYALLAFALFAVGVFDAARGRYGEALLMFAAAAFEGWLAAGGAVVVVDDEDISPPEVDQQKTILSKGYEPVETPTDDGAPLTWADHTRNCKICQVRGL